MKSTRIAPYCKWIFFLITLITFTLTNTNQAAAQTAIANPAGTTVTTACTADTRAIGFPNGNTFTYANTGWPSCTAWGFSSTAGIPVCRANVIATATPPYTYDNVTYNAAAPTNLAGGVMCFTGTTNYRASNGTTYANRATNIRMVVTVTDNSGNPMRLQVSGGYVYVVIPDPSFTFRAKVELQAQGPASVVYYTTGNGTTVPIGCTSNPNNSYTCANYLNTWVGAIQLYNCISTESTYKIVTQFTGSTFLSGGVPAAPATPTGAATICPGGNANIVASNPASGTLYYWQTATNGTVITNAATSANYNVAPTSTTTYYVRPLVGTCWGTASAGVTVTVNADPAATTPTITNATVCAGNGSTVLSSNGSLGITPYTFNWQYDNSGYANVVAGTPPASTYTVGGVTPNSTLTVANITSPGTYNYRLRVSGGSGCAGVSAGTTLTVVADPTAPTLNVATPANNSTICVGGTVSATFNLSSNGTGTCTDNYRSSIDGGTTWLAYTPGATLTSVTAGANRIQIQTSRVCSGNGCDGAGETYATVAQWTVAADPTFTLQPVAGTICSGGTRVLTATVSPVTGPVYTYDWQESNDNGVGDPWATAVGGSGATTLSYTTPALTANLYHRLVVTSTTGGCTTPITSSSVLTTVVADPVAPNPGITNASVCRGGSTVVSSLGSGGSGTILYQWQYNNGGTWVNTSNGTPVGFTYATPTATSMTITTNNALTTATGTFQFRVRVYTATSGCETYSNAVDFTVASDPTAPTLNVATPATGSTICIGAQVSATFNLSSNGTGVCTDNYQYTLTGAAPFTAYTPGALLTATSAGANRIIIQTSRTCAGNGCDGAGETFATVAQWTVVADPTIATHPTATTICTGGTVSLTSTVTAGTGTGTVTYQWEESNDNGGSDAWASAVGGSGATTTAYTSPVLTSNIYYRLRVNHTTGLDCTNPIYSNSALITIAADPVAPNPGITNASVCRGGSTVVSSLGSGGSGTILYQWQYNNGGTWANTSNGTPVGFTYATPTATSMTITTNNAITTPTGTFQFRVRVYTATSGCETYSNAVDFTVASDPTAPTLNVATPTTSTVICIGGSVSATFNVSSNGTGVCTDNYQYTLTGAAPFFPYTPGASLTATSAGTNRIIIQTSRTCAGNGCDGAGETFATVAQWTVAADPTITTHPTPSSTICSGGTVTLTGVVTPVTGPVYAYQWEESNDNGVGDAWANAVGGSGANTLSYTTPALTSTIYYRLYITSTSNGCTTPIISNSALVTVVADPTAPNPSITNASVCRGGATVVASLGSGGSGTILYQWQYNNGGTWANVVNATPVGFTYGTPTATSMTITTANGVTTPTGTFQFRVRVYTATSGCETFSNAVDFTVASDPTAPTLNVASPGSGTSICIGDQVSATFNLSSNGTGVCTDNYQYTLTGAAPFTAYTPGALLTATSAGTNRIIIQTSRTCAGNGCDGTGETFATVAQWTVLTAITGGSFVYTNPISCTTSNGTITVTAPTGGSGTYNYSRTSTNGSNGTWQASTSFTGIADGASGTVWVRNSVAPYCPISLGTYNMQEPYEPIAAPTAASNISNLCSSNIATLTASGLEPGSGGSNSGGAYSYNGTNQYYYNAAIAGFPTGSVATVEAWVNPVNSQADATYNGIVSFGPNPATNYNRFLMAIQSNGVPSFASWNNDFVPTSVNCAALPWGQWSHLCMVLNGTGANNISFYINGNLAVTGTTNNAALTNLLASGRITIGCTDPAGGRYFEGNIANVKVWNVARTQAQIQADMYLEVPTVTTGLVARYNFNANANCQNNGTYNLTAVNAPVSVTPTFYTYTWTGGIPTLTANPTPSTAEVQTSGVITGTSPFQVAVTCWTNCASPQSNVAPVNDFAGAYTVTLDPADVQACPSPVSGAVPGTGSGANVLLPVCAAGNNYYGHVAGTPVGNPGYSETGVITASNGTWDRCVNWGLPVNSTSTVGPRVGFTAPGPTTTLTNLQYLTQGQPNSSTNLSLGLVTYSGTVTVPSGVICGNAACGIWYTGTISVYVTLAVVNSGGAAIPLDYTSSGHIVMRAAQNFKVRSSVKVVVPSAGSGIQYYSCGGNSTAGALVPILDWYDCVYKNPSTAINLTYSFNFNSFPRFTFTDAPNTGTDFSICVGGVPASAITLQGDFGSLNTTCGSLAYTWEGPSAYTNSGTITGTPPAILVGSAITTSTSPTTFGTYYFTVSQGPVATSNVCYGTSSVIVTQNVPVVGSPFAWPNGAAGTSYLGTAAPASWNPSLQVIGNDSWYDNRNWDHCVPDAATNAFINYNATNPANINTNVSGYWGTNAKTKFLKIDVPNSAKLMINANGTTKLNVTD